MLALCCRGVWVLSSRSCILSQIFEQSTLQIFQQCVPYGFSTATLLLVLKHVGRMLRYGIN